MFTQLIYFQASYSHLFHTRPLMKLLIVDSDFFPSYNCVARIIIIILHICMYRASFLLREIYGKKKEENIVRFRSYMKSTDIVPMEL